jgi:hypothetical protein
LEQSDLETDTKKKGWFLLASVNSARAVVEVVLRKLEDGMLKGEKDAFSEEAIDKVPYFKVVASLRIQDFHRRAVRFVPGGVLIIGPFELFTGNSPKGSAAMISAAGKPFEKQTAKSGYVKQNRPIQIKGFEVNVEGEGWVPLNRILDVYLREVETFIERFIQAQP